MKKQTEELKDKSADSIVVIGLKHDYGLTERELAPLVAKEKAGGLSPSAQLTLAIIGTALREGHPKWNSVQAPSFRRIKQVLRKVTPETVGISFHRIDAEIILKAIEATLWREDQAFLLPVFLQYFRKQMK